MSRKLLGNPMNLIRNLRDIERIDRLIFIFLTTYLCTWLSAAIAEEVEYQRTKLFSYGSEVIGAYNGCRFALWSNNAIPQDREQSYLIFAPFNDGEMLPAWIKPGEQIEELERKGAVGPDGLFDSYQIFKSHSDNVTMILEIKDYTVEGDSDFISDAKVTVVESGKLPFIHSQLEGHLFCPQLYQDTENTESLGQVEQLEGFPISLYGRQDYEGFEQVPSTILEHIESQSSDCDLSNVPQYATSYKISDAMTLWELPCAVYARNTSSVFFTALNENDDHFAPLEVSGWSDSKITEKAFVLNAAVEPNSATISSVSLGPSSDCGTYELHQLRAVEGEAIELKLVEYRRKTNCDGEQTAPETFPLIYLRK